MVPNPHFEKRKSQSGSLVQKKTWSSMVNLSPQKLHPLLVTWLFSYPRLGMFQQLGAVKAHITSDFNGDLNGLIIP